MKAALAPLVLTVLVSTAEARADEPSAPASRERTSLLELSIRGGVGAGISIMPPLPFASPGAGVGLSWSTRFWGRGIFGVHAGADLGAAEGAGLIGGYAGRLQLGLDWIDSEHVRLESLLLAGLEGYNFVPLPVVGMSHELSFALVRTRWFTWRLGGELLGYALLATPVVGGEGFSTFAFGGEALVATVRLYANWKAGFLPGIKAGAGVELGLGWRY